MDTISSSIKAIATAKYLYDNKWIIIPVAGCILDCTVFVAKYGIKKGIDITSTYISQCKCSVCEYHRDKGLIPPLH